MLVSGAPPTLHLVRLCAPTPVVQRWLTRRLAYLREGELMFMSRSRVRRGDIRVMGAPTHPPLCRRAQEKCCEMTAEGEGERRGEGSRRREGGIGERRGGNIIILYLGVASIQRGRHLRSV